MGNIISNLFQGFGKHKDAEMLHTPYGDFNLAKEGDRRKVQRIVCELQRSTDALTRKDIGDWRNAWQLAISVEHPNRSMLYDIYRDVNVDLHLSGCIEQRKGFVLAKEFKLVDKNDNENEEAHSYFDQAWFKHLSSLCLDAPYYGHSLIELGEIVYDGSKPYGYDHVTLIPRKHVVPEYGRILIDLGQDIHSGIDYRKPPYIDSLIEVGTPDDLGLFLKAATQTIPKKNMMAFWDTFGEIFGMPMRLARTTSRNDADIAKLEQMMRDTANNSWSVMGMDTEIQFIENGRGDAFNVYDKRIDRANSELSKLIIGQTMTIEDGSSLSQSQTHLEVFENLVDKDRDMLRDVVNNQLLPKMEKNGFPVGGLTFEWNDTINYTPEQQISFETMIADRYEVDPEYFSEKYNMPVGQRRQMVLPTAEPEEDDDKKKQQKTVKPFFD